MSISIKVTRNGQDITGLSGEFQRNAAVIPSSPLPVLLPGYLLSLAIKKITGVNPCGYCIARIQTMNQWGWWGCWRKRKTIAGWLSEEARRRGHQVTESNALSLLMAAFKEANKESKK